MSDRRGSIIDLARVRRALAALDRLVANYPELRDEETRDRLCRYLAVLVGNPEVPKSGGSQ